MRQRIALLLTLLLLLSLSACRSEEKSQTPDEPENFGEQDGKPEKPGGPEAPSNPDKPGESESPGEQDGEQGKPTEPGKPDKPENPDEQDTPGEPENPGGQPAEPEKPTEPDLPDEPENPALPGWDDQLRALATLAADWRDEESFMELNQLAVTDLDRDGLLEVVRTNFGGSGMFTYTHIFELTEDLTAVQVWPFLGGDWELTADISMYSEMTTVMYETGDTLEYIFEDYTRLGMAENFTDILALHIRDNTCAVTELASMRVVMVPRGDDYEEEVTYTTINGGTDEASYESAAATYFQGLPAWSVALQFFPLESFDAAPDEVLLQSWTAFSLTKL